MSSEDTTPQTQSSPEDLPDHPLPLVEVKVDGRHLKVRRGTWIVIKFKAAVQVPPDYELDQVVHDDLKPLADDESIEIRGGETFVSHVRQGGSS